MSNTPEQLPTYPQFTNLKLNDGLFDQIMAAVDVHLNSQYTKQRLRGAEYAQVYAGSIEAAMANTTQFLLGTLLLDEQRLKINAEICLMKAQEKQIEAEILKIQAEIENLKLQAILIEAQIRKIDAEILYLEAQKDMMEQQAQKIIAEIAYLGAKLNTENANVSGAGVDPDSVIGRQKSLLVAQKYGFAGDLQQKAAKLHADYDSVYQTVHESPEATLSGPTLEVISEILGTDTTIGTVGLIQGA